MVLDLKRKKKKMQPLFSEYRKSIYFPRASEEQLWPALAINELVLAIPAVGRAQQQFCFAVSFG